MWVGGWVVCGCATGVGKGGGEGGERGASGLPTGLSGRGYCHCQRLLALPPATASVLPASAAAPAAAARAAGLCRH